MSKKDKEKKWMKLIDLVAIQCHECSEVLTEGQSLREGDCLKESIQGRNEKKLAKKKHGEARAADQERERERDKCV